MMAVHTQSADFSTLRKFLLWVLLFVPLFTFAQTENCSNGIDDDGDNLVDFYDPDCSCGTVGCGNPYYNICAPSTARHHCLRLPYRPLRSGLILVPTWGLCLWWGILMEIVFPTFFVKLLLPSSRSSTPPMDNSNSPFQPTPFNYTTLALGNVDNDPEVEIFLTRQITSTTGRITRYDYNATGNNVTQTWMANTTVNPRYGPSLADFNQDGIPEVYTGNQIFNSQTGIELANGGGANNQGYYPLGSSVFMVSVSVAADVLPNSQCTNCSGLELVAGNQVYAVNLASMTNPALNSMTVAVTGPERDGASRLVDFDRDGDLDAVCTAMQGITSGPRIWVWDLQTPAQLGQTYQPPNAPSPRIGPPTIADFDNDGWPEIAVCTSYNFSVLNDYNSAGGTTWGSNNATTLAATLTTSDQSGATGITAFDFNGDGAYEIVYRDQTQLRVFNSTLNTVASFGCTSGTATEYPVIADIDADGDTEILVTCGSNLQAYQSSNTPWIPARSIWNQFNYFNVNVNDDGTIPRQQQWHHIVGDSVILNNFMVQQAVLDTSGIPLYPIPDAGLVILDDTCISGQIQLELEICNTGDQTFPAGTPIAFYDDDPTLVNAGLVTVQNTPSNIQVGDCDTLVLNLTTTVGPLFVVANDDGTLGRPYNLSSQFPVTNTLECNYLNNIDNVNFNCTVFSGGIDSTWNNPCNADSLGAIFASASGPFPAYTFSLDGTNFQASGSFSNLPAGNYTVTIRDANGWDTTFTTTISAPPATVFQVTNFSNITCFGENNGQIIVGAGGGTPPYQYSLNGGAFQASNTFSNLPPGNQVLVLEDVNGCRDTLTQLLTEPPALILSVDSVGPSSLCASALVELSATGGTPALSFALTGYPYQASGTFIGVPSGNLWAYVQDANGCTDSAAISVSGPPSLQVAVATLTNISCNGLTDGAVTLSGTGGVPAYEFSLDNVNYQSGTGYSNLGPGNYLAYVRDVTGCLDSVSFTILEPAPVSINGTASTNISCFGAGDGSLTVSGSGGTSPYQYSLNGGSQQTSGTFSTLGPGTYTLTVEDANGCTSQTTATLTEPSLLELVIEAQSDEICTGAADGMVQVSASGGTPGYTYSLNGGNVQNSRTFAGLAPGNYTVAVTDNNGCTANVSTTIEPGNAPSAAFEVWADSCNPDGPVVFTNLSTGATSYIWNLGDGNSSADQDPVHIYSDRGSITIRLTAEDANGCTDQTTQTISLYDLPIADFSVIPGLPVVVESGTGFRFTNLSQNSNVWRWEFGDGSFSNQEHPRHIFNELGQYCITLTAWNQVGCPDTTEQCYVEVEDLTIFFPNAFSPNGDDLNDRFGVVSLMSFNTFTLEIFNRWGQRIFTGDSFNDVWDGTFKGQPVQEGVYVYRFLAETQSGKKLSRSGSITVIR